MMTEIKKLAHILRYFPLFILTGVSAGLLGYAFRESIAYAGEIRRSHPSLIFLLPLTSLFVTAMYRLILKRSKNGAKTVISAVRDNAPVKMPQLPLVFIASFLTHLTGGSAGREGAVLEMGGVLGDRAVSLLNRPARKWRRHRRIHLLPEEEKFDTQRRVAILCGMAGAFSALFVTPLAAVFFVLEVTDSRKILHRFVPVFFTSMIAFSVVCLLGWEPTRLPYHLPDPMPTACFIRSLLLAGGCALTGRFFCTMIKTVPRLSRYYIKNDYMRAFLMSGSVLLLTLAIGNDRFNGLGTETINNALLGKGNYFDFFWKTVFTALTLAAGLKGGEIIPAIFVGATFGAAFSPLIGFLPDLGASIGVVAILASVAKAPAAAFFLGIELFGIEGAIFYAAGSLIAFWLSGTKGLYS